jgi:serine/threonine-protein kinase
VKLKGEQTVEIDELKLAWQTLDARLERQTDLQWIALRDERVTRARARLWPLRTGLMLQILVALACIAYGVTAWTGDGASLRTVAEGAILHVYGIVSIICAGVVFARLHRVTWSAPVVGIQKQLADIQRFQSAASLTLGLAWWFLWIVWFDVSCSMFTPVDLYARAPAFFWISALIGVAGIAVPWLAYHWFSRHPKYRERAARLLHASAGSSSLSRAGALLAEIERFEKN